MRLSRRNQDWVIMGASAWISGKPSIEKIIKENGNRGTIIVASREDYGYNKKPINIFILGSNGHYGEVGDKKTFLKDTGLGYGGEGVCIIQNVINIKPDGTTDSWNEIGLNEKRPLWVFK